MKLQDINLLFEYNRWANLKILGTVSELTEEQFTREIKSSYSSIRDTLFHILASQWFWQMVWKLSFKATSHRDVPTFDIQNAIAQSVRLGEMPSPQNIPNFDKLHNRWAEVDKETQEFITDLTDETLQKEIPLNDEGKQLRYQLWQTMLQIVTLSSYHRGQVVTMLCQLGIKPPATDLLIFL